MPAATISVKQEEKEEERRGDGRIGNAKREAPSQRTLVGKARERRVTADSRCFVTARVNPVSSACASTPTDGLSHGSSRFCTDDVTEIWLAFFQRGYGGREKERERMEAREK